MGGGTRAGAGRTSSNVVRQQLVAKTDVDRVEPVLEVDWADLVMVSAAGRGQLGAVEVALVAKARQVEVQGVWVLGGSRAVGAGGRQDGGLPAVAERVVALAVAPGSRDPVAVMAAAVGKDAGPDLLQHSCHHPRERLVHLAPGRRGG